MSLPRAGTLPLVLNRLRQNLEEVRGRIRAAQARGAHAAASVRLVVVTKSAPPEIFGLLAEAGATDVGENRVQAALARRPEAPEGLTWHGIGHLQRNKAARAVDVFDVFHALDSRRLASRLESVLAGTDRLWPVFVQVNAADDPAKGGFQPEETLGFVTELAARHPHLVCRGLMTIGRLGADEATCRAAFRTMRDLRDDAVRAGRGDEPPRELSMGMTDDFEPAVEEGATVVRVGRAVLEGVLEREVRR
jgi:pyridoxal phosphate enzyme (YggS family)